MLFRGRSMTLTSYKMEPFITMFTFSESKIFEIIYSAVLNYNESITTR